jgi:hypothetical protein
MLAALHSSASIETLQVFARRDIVAFAGLAHPTTLDDVAAVFDLDRSWHRQEPLGSERRGVDWFAAGAAGFGRGIRVFASDGAVVLLDAPDVDLSDRPPGLPDMPGEPDARLDTYLGMSRIAGGEWVYARRGLTLCIIPESGVLFRLLAFAPTDLETYSRRLRLDLKVKLLPDFERHQ